MFGDNWDPNDGRYFYFIMNSISDELNFDLVPYQNFAISATDIVVDKESIGKNSFQFEIDLKFKNDSDFDINKAIFYDKDDQIIDAKLIERIEGNANRYKYEFLNLENNLKVFQFKVGYQTMDYKTDLLEITLDEVDPIDPTDPVDPTDPNNPVGPKHPAISKTEKTLIILGSIALGLFLSIITIVLAIILISKKQQNNK